MDCGGCVIRRVAQDVGAVQNIVASFLPSFVTLRVFYPYMRLFSFENFLPLVTAFF